MRNWMNYPGAILLILLGIILYWCNFQIAGIPTLALPLIIAGLLWGGSALAEAADRRTLGGDWKPGVEASDRGWDPNLARSVRGHSNSLRRHRCRSLSRDDSLYAGPAGGVGYRRPRGSQHATAHLPAAAARFLDEGDLVRPHVAETTRDSIAVHAQATVAESSFRESLRNASREVKVNLCGGRGSMWAVLCGITLSLTSAELLLSGREPSLSDRSEILHCVTSLTIVLGLLAASTLVSSSMAEKKEHMTLERMLFTPKKGGALLLGKICSVMVAWLLIFVISIPYVLLVGFGTSVTWTALIYTFVLGTLCVMGFAALIVSITALARSGRGVTLATSLAVFIVMTAPALLGTALQKSWFGTFYNTLSPFAHATLSLDSVIVYKEGLLVQVPYIGALAAFAVIAGVYAACGVSLQRN